MDVQTRQLDLFPSAQSAWQDALDALERFEIGAARRLISGAAAASDERESFRSMVAAVDWLEAMGLTEASAPAELSAALWDVPEWSRAGELAPGAARKVLDVLARRLVACSRTMSVESAALARAHLLLGAVDAARRALDAAGSQQRWDARFWSARADVWAREGHEDARLSYGRALALDPAAVELEWIADTALRESFEKLVEQYGFALARERLLVETWLARRVDLPQAESEFGIELNRRRSALESRASDSGAVARRFALLLAEDLAFDDRATERRELMQALDGPLFSRVLDRRRRDESQRLTGFPPVR